jgi:hypothetical protein
MPFYFRKSVSAGPFRFNFSKGGIGASVGVRGFRIGTGPRGHYVHAGRGGVYYRATMGVKKARRHGVTTPVAPPRQQVPGHYPEPNVDMIRVSSADVLAMQDERFADLLAELNMRQARLPMSWMLGLAGLALGALTFGVFGAAVLTALGALAGHLIDSVRRASVLFYELEDDAQQAYIELTEAFDAMAGCSAKWHVDAGGAVRDIHTWKRNAGAQHLIDKRPTTLGYSLPRVIKSNVCPPAIQVGKETLYFFPDVLIIVHDNKIGAVAYDALAIRWQDSRFIEDGAVPRDATIIGRTWLHPNKNGGPDRRFANNYEVPICLYEAVHLTSTNGLNELLHLSRKGLAQPFAEALEWLQRAVGKRSHDPMPSLISSS